jgi:hypothetical protein
MIAGAVSSVLMAGSPAQALSITLGSTNFTGTEGTVDNNTSTASNINVSAPNNGFGNGTTGFFSTNFLLLGALGSDSSIPLDSRRGGNSTAVSSTFYIDPSQLASDLTISFQWAFRGNSLGGSGDNDNFNVFLLTPDFQQIELLARQVSSSGYGSNLTQSATVALNLLTAGDYFIGITLNENSDFFNRSSAAGFNNFVITADELPPGDPVPFDFSATPGLLILGGMFGISYLRKRQQQSK